MANVLKMADQAGIIGLQQRGWSQRRIARETGIHRETVSRYVRLAQAQESRAPCVAMPGSSYLPLTSDSAARDRWSVATGR